MKKLSLVSWLAALLLLLLGLAPAGRAFAQSGGTVLADNLNGPRGVAVGPDGSVYVTEVGPAGSETVGSGDEAVQRGYTGQITKVGPNGARSVLAVNAPSLNAQGESSGLEGLIWGNGALWAAVSPTAPGVAPLAGEGGIIRIDPATGMTQTIANLVAFEAANNPDPNMVDSNPYGLTLGPDGMIYAVDAAGNDVLKVNPSSGQVSLVAVIPGIALPPEVVPPGGNPARGGANEIDPVPTGIDFGPDGAMYVSLLSGGPFPEGAAKIMRVTTGGAVSAAVEGLTMLTDVKLGPDGAWYAVQFGKFDLTSNPPGFAPNSGQIWRIAANGARSVAVGGLSFPNKIDFDSNGNVYVSINSAGGPGQLVRYDGVASTTTAPGMPRTGGESLPFELAIYGSLLLLVAGFVFRARAQRSA